MKYSPLFLAISATVSQLSYAEKISTEGSREEALEEENQAAVSLDNVVVSGSYFNDYKVDEAKGAMRSHTSLLETPQSVTVISDTIIDEQLATTLGDVLINDASLTAGSKQINREVFNLRGFELSSGTGYLRDGHQHWSHYQQPIETLESVEVLKGPSSILYGTSGPGGLINMVTKKPTYYDLLNVSADVDHLGSTRFMVDAGGALTENKDLRYRATLVKQDVNFEREYQNGEQRQRDRILGSLVLDYNITETALVSFHYDRTNDKAGLDGGAWLDESGDVIGDDEIIRDMSWAFTDITVENIGVDFELALNESWDLSVGYNEQSFTRQRFESSPTKPVDYQAGDSYESTPYDRHDDWQFKTAFIDFNGDFEFAGLEHRMLIGANYLDYSYGQLKTTGESITHTPGQPEPERPDISYKTDDELYTSQYHYYGLYVQDLIALNEQWQISVGGRYDQQKEEDADNQSLLPKAAILFSPDDQTTIYASYSESFEPQESETLNDDNDINNGMELEAMTAEQVELGAKWQLMDERLLLTTAIFDISKVGKLVTEDISDPDFNTRTTQAGEQRHKGFEIAAQGAASDKLFIMASAMNLIAVYEDDDLYEGNTPADVADWSASIWSRYELTNKLALNAGAFYEGERFADNENTIVKDAYTRIDVGASYKIKLSKSDINLRFNIQNLLDTEYLAGGGPSSATIGEGRSFRLAVQIAM
jgi:iron complex outermembrane receptor protein